MVKRDKGLYIMKMGSIHQEDITVVNIYATNIRVSKYIFKKILTELTGEINRNTVIVGDLNTHSQQWTDHPENQ